MNQPNPLLRWAIHHFAGGDAFLCGLVAVVVCQFALVLVREPRWRRWLIIGGRVGLVWTIADPPAVPLLLVAGVVSLFAAWLVYWWRSRKPADPAEEGRRHTDQGFRIALGCFALSAIAFELPYTFFERLNRDIKTVCIVGDSITAGLNDGEDTWPRQLARRAPAAVLDASQPGATLKSARQQLQRLDPGGDNVLVLEIGGNDLLEGLPPSQFEHDLDRLLADSQSADRMIVMFELPLPPLATRYGAIQRRLANQHRVRLIPRRELTRILTTSGATVDGIHLSATGQTQLADFVQKLLELPASGADGVDRYRHFEPDKLQRR